VDIHGAVIVLTPMLAAGAVAHDHDHRLRLLINDVLRTYEITDYLLWYYSPVAMGFTRHLFPRLVVWDCIEQSAAGGSPEHEIREAQLLAWADLVFTSGSSLHQAKRQLHPHVSNIPSAIDTAHFAKARRTQSDPSDQEDLLRPRVGCHLALDEFCDLVLLQQCSALRPDWQWILVGPVAPGMAGRLPRADNLHYLGAKDLSQLPYYMSGWDAGIVPLVRDASTRFANPPEVAELLAAGRPVVATAVEDLRHIYGDDGLVLLADEPREVIRALERAMLENGNLWRAAVDNHQHLNSWDGTYVSMLGLIEAAIAGKQSSRLDRVRA
jgi:glycosyltransferase involved in cell wall biosynthesis